MRQVVSTRAFFAVVGLECKVNTSAACSAHPISEELTIAIGLGAAGPVGCVLWDPDVIVDDRQLRALVRLGPDVQVQLAIRGNIRTQRALAKHKTLHEEAQLALAESDDFEVRRELIWNNRCMGELLELFADDPSEDIRMEVASAAHVPTSTLRLLAKDPAWRVRCYVGENARTPRAVLLALSRDTHPTVVRLAKRTLERR